MKRFCILALCLLMTSCYYKDSCWYTAQSVYCPVKSDKNRSPFDYYQKSDISDEEKIMDMKDCAGEYAGRIDYRKYLFGQLRKLPKLNAVREFSQCMQHSKGYTYDPQGMYDNKL